MKIVVTGGAGFIGSHVVDRLLNDGYEVVSLDDFTLGTRKHFAHHLGKEKFKFIELDVAENKKLAETFLEFKPDCVFHFAANSDIQSGSIDSSIDLHKTFMTTVSVLEAMKSSGCKNIVFASSSVVYGERDSQNPISETSGPFLPISNYGAAKLASEGFISAYSNTYDFKAWIFRFANICGPRSTHGVFVNFLRFLRNDAKKIEVARDGKQAKPYVYVLDIVEAIMLGWHNGGSEQINIYNIGNTPLVSVNEILDAILKEKGITSIERQYTNAPAWAGDVITYAFDDSKIRAIGYKPKYDSKEAVLLTTKELVHNPEAAIAI
ncbi:MAG: SDR family NAD(P)-dependent oxidoreductase [Patescibacteria group bacterium]